MRGSILDMRYEEYEQLIIKIKGNEKKRLGFQSIEVTLKKLFIVIMVTLSLYTIFDMIKSPLSIQSFTLRISLLALFFNIISVFTNTIYMRTNNFSEIILNRILYYLHLEVTLRNSNDITNDEKNKLLRLLKDNLNQIYK
jgi:hypothetical protein